MADSNLSAGPAFPDLSRANSDRLAVCEISGVAIATIGVAPQAVASADAALLANYGATLPRPGRRTSIAGLDLIWVGPSQWLALADGDGGFDLERDLKQTLGALASVTDASDARALLRISGARARAVLARGLPIDLHTRAFKVDDVALTHAAHIGVAIWRLDDAPTFELAVSRSYAASFADWLIEAAASEAAAPL
ncbi:MAG: sarcosine oxidase subunit gamma [Hyphomicrobium sp.]